MRRARSSARPAAGNARPKPSVSNSSGFLANCFRSSQAVVLRALCGLERGVARARKRRLPQQHAHRSPQGPCRFFRRGGAVRSVWCFRWASAGGEERNVLRRANGVDSSDRKGGWAVGAVAARRLADERKAGPVRLVARQLQRKRAGLRVVLPHDPPQVVLRPSGRRDGQRGTAGRSPAVLKGVGSVGRACRRFWQVLSRKGLAAECRNRRKHWLGQTVFGIAPQ